MINEIYLNSFANSRFILTQQELADALMVGNQCVYDGGPAVLTARLVVSTQYPFYLFNDNILCGGSTARVKPKDKKGVAAKGDFKIYPNPATDNLLVELPVETNGSLEIFNHLGQKVSSQKISERFIKANAKNLANGVYYLVINGDNVSYNKIFEVKR
jgi:Secretion system C-terminal sorting domain